MSIVTPNKPLFVTEFELPVICTRGVSNNCTQVMERDLILSLLIISIPKGHVLTGEHKVGDIFVVQRIFQLAIVYKILFILYKEVVTQNSCFWDGRRACNYSGSVWNI